MLHTVRFLWWVKHNRAQRYTSSQMKELVENLSIRLDQLHEMDCVLFQNVELPQFEADIIREIKQRRALKRKACIKPTKKPEGGLLRMAMYAQKYVEPKKPVYKIAFGRAETSVSDRKPVTPYIRQTSISDKNQGGV